MFHLEYEPNNKQLTGLEHQNGCEQTPRAGGRRLRRHWMRGGGDPQYNNTAFNPERRLRVLRETERYTSSQKHFFNLSVGTFARRGVSRACNGATFTCYNTDYILHS